MVSITTVIGRLGPGVPGLREVVLSIQRNLVAENGTAQGQLDSLDSQEWIIIAIENMLVLEP